MIVEMVQSRTRLLAGALAVAGWKSHTVRKWTGVRGRMPVDAATLWQQSARESSHPAG
jgi:hypothetical protein